MYEGQGLTDAEAKRAYAVIGELMLTATMLDHQLNRICILFFSLTQAPMLEPLIASIDTVRKIEVLKLYASKLKKSDWSDNLKKHAKRVEAINRDRNTAAHSIMGFQGGKVIFYSAAATKLLKSINSARPAADYVDLAKLENAVLKGRETFASGENLLQNLERVEEARAKFRARQGGS